MTFTDWWFRSTIEFPDEPQFITPPAILVSGGRSRVHAVRVEPAPSPERQSRGAVLAARALPSGQLPADEAVRPYLGLRSTWQNVTYSVGKFFIFSAYFDRRLDKKFVRIIATGRLRLPRTIRALQCVLHYSDGSKETVTAEHKVIRENWGLAYTARFVLCNTDRLPLRVSLVEKLDDPNPATVAVSDLDPSVERLGNFAVCVKPFHYQFNRAVWLVEFIEFHRLLGVNHFVFYNHTVGTDVERVLRFYESRGVATVIQWEMQLRSQKEIRTENMFAALNDCVYRSMYRYRYALLVDVDEYIVPRQHLGYGDMFELLDSRRRANYGSFVFKNCFFYLYWENDTAVAEQLQLSQAGERRFPYLITLFKTRRMRDPFRFFSRSKYFVAPERAVEVGNHQVWQHVPGFKAMSVGEHYGLVHHYRICEMGGFECKKKPSVIDRTTHKYLRQLTGQVLTLCAAIFGDSCPEAPPLGSPW
ncbi:uncharacterized protein LOC122369400 [Amphibalanus amphitrite]|uniref:uncharacterized protein LOC122369400 n=1 Tax=Amphibalanus amphitrite TaxID=1232801 RepID=UPI001C92B053|nr:uncharacterized protein LOC122369400 [Amphibalanus amphitrite]